MNWNELGMYVIAKQMELVCDSRFPPQEKVIDKLESDDIVTIRRLTQ